MEQVIFGGYYNTLDPTTTEYNSLVGGYSWESVEAYFTKLVSTDGVIKNLRVKLNDSPGAGKKYTFTLMINGNPSALTLEIADAATSGADTTHEIDVVAGDTAYLRCAPTGTPTARYATWTSMFEGDTAKESLIMGGSISSLSSTSTEYAQVMGAHTGYTTNENNFRQVVPTAGTIKNLYVKLTADPGTSPDAYRFTLRKGGASQTLTVTITADNTTGNDTVHEVAVVAGDILTLMIEPLNTPSATPAAYWGMTFVADTDGESIILGGSVQSLSASATWYNYFTGHEGNLWIATEAEHYQLGQLCTLKKLYVLLSAAPGAGKSYTFTVRIAVADSNVVATVADAATTGNSGALEDTVVNDDYVDLESTPAGTPAAAAAYWGLVSYRAPPVGAKSANMGSKMVAAGLL